MRQVNLLPEYLQQAEKNRIIRDSVLITAGPLLLIMLVIHFLLGWRISRLQKLADKPAIVKETRETIELRDGIKKIQEDASKFIEDNEHVIEVFAKNIPSSNILKTIGDITSGKVWLDGLSIDNGKKTYQMHGKSFNTRLVSEFMLELRRMPYFTSVELVSMDKVSDTKETEIVDFKIICNLR